jgi:hypothetical protein
MSAHVDVAEALATSASSTASTVKRIITPEECLQSSYAQQGLTHSFSRLHFTMLLQTSKPTLLLQRRRRGGWRGVEEAGEGRTPSFN